MNQDILKIYIAAGMTEKEFFEQMRICYASYVAALLDENPNRSVVVHTSQFTDCNIIIESRKEYKHNKNTIN